MAEGFVGGRRISGRLDRDAKEGDSARNRRKWREYGSLIACHSPYIAVVTRQVREPLLRGDYTKSYRWITPTASLTMVDGPTSVTRLADPITMTVFRRLDSPKLRSG